MLFQEKDRTYNGPKSHIEGDFEYLDRSARTESCKVRQFLNHWISQLPEDEAKEVMARIKSEKKGALSQQHLNSYYLQ